MKLMGIIVVLVGIGTASGLARIGDTIEELRKRYGAASHLHDEEGGLTVVEYEKPPFSLIFKLLDLKTEGVEVVGDMSKTEAEVLIARNVPSESFTPVELEDGLLKQTFFVFFNEYHFNSGTKAYFSKGKLEGSRKAKVQIDSPKMQQYDLWLKGVNKKKELDSANNKIDSIESAEAVSDFNPTTPKPSKLPPTDGVEVAAGTNPLVKNILRFQTIDMLALGKGNSSIAESNGGGGAPVGFRYGTPAYYGGVPFFITDQSNQVWHAARAPGGNGTGVVSETFPIAVNNVYGFYTLAGLWWGVAGSYVTYTFNFSDGSSYSKRLTNNVDLRDFNIPSGWANSINGTTTQNVFAAGSYHLDRQWIDLATAGHGGKNLVSFTVTDRGSSGRSRIFLAAATAQVGAPGQIPPGAVDKPEHLLPIGDPQSASDSSSAMPPPPDIYRDLSAVSGGAAMGQDASFASMGTPLGRYQHKLYLAIGSRWNLKVSQMKAKMPNLDRVVVRFQVNADGTLSDIDIVQGNPNSILGTISADSIKQSSDLIGPFPVDLKAEKPNGFPWQLAFRTYKSGD